MTPDERLSLLLQKLKKNGVDTHEIAHLEAAIQTTKKPLHKRALDVLKINWSRVKGEISESKRLTQLLKKSRIEGSSSLTEKEKHFVREQLIDFFRIFPASLIAGINAILPIPGTGLFTPHLLKKLGLLPSRWREANMLKTLQEAHLTLLKKGDSESLRLLEDLQDDLNQEAQQRSVCDLLAVWDRNQNGVWDEEEEAAYQEEIKRTLSIMKTSAKERSWFILHQGLVFGPSALENIPNDLESVLVRYEEKTQWVRYQDLVQRPK
jgi:hypothetical protein